MAEATAGYERDLRKLVLRYRRGDVTVEDLEDISLTVLRELDEQEGDEDSRHDHAEEE